MKKFRFTLQPVQTLRGLQEMRAREGFAAAIRAVTARRDDLQRQQVRVTAFVESLVAGRRRGFAGGTQAAFLRGYHEELLAEKRANDALAEAEKAREVARQRWVDAHLQLQLVHKLRDKARGRHQVELLRFEQAQLDERGVRETSFSES